MHDRSATWPWLILLSVIGVAVYPLVRPSAPIPPGAPSDAKSDEHKTETDAKVEKVELSQPEYGFALIQISLGGNPLAPTVLP
jgi:hypothetical protein